jgi:hypothetical protein
MTSRDDWGGDWLDRLPFREIWLGDGEWYPGKGLANGGVHGDRATPFACAPTSFAPGG